MDGFFVTCWTEHEHIGGLNMLEDVVGDFALSLRLSIEYFCVVCVQLCFNVVKQKSKGGTAEGFHLQTLNIMIFTQEKWFYSSVLLGPIFLEVFCFLFRPSESCPGQGISRKQT